MKVILNDDVKHLGEMGDVKNVAAGYARNYLFPRMLAVPYTAQTVAFFEGKKAEIEARKEAKRAEAASLKSKLEALSVSLSMPAGKNGKLFGAVTSQTIADYLASNGFDIERKRIEVPGLTIKNTGKYDIVIRLYESSVAEIKIEVVAQGDEKVEEAAKEEAKDGE
ncbi:MAG: 50S ribosomal protein L9 [Treponemataceae bacterium]|nr:50S ribosomal protein L9 [Treponemataceae bacterium]